MPNFDVWYPLGISATVYSLMTIWLAIKRFVRRLRRFLGLHATIEGTVDNPVRKLRSEAEPGIIITPIRASAMPTRELSKNDM